MAKVKRNKPDAPLAPTGPEPEIKAWELDPLDLYGQMADEYQGTIHPGTIGLDFDTLRALSRVHVLAAIHGTRSNQVANFAVPAVGRYDMGFAVRMKDREGAPDASTRKRIVEVTDWLLTCGDERVSYDATLEGLLRCIVRDTLTFDQVCIEKARTRGGALAGLVPVDAGTVRRAVPTETERTEGRRAWDKTAFVQIIDHKVVARWDAEDFIFGIRRPRTWIRARGYGFPEPEELVRTITYLLNSETYNAANFTHGVHVASIIALKSGMDPQLFRAFKREFYAMLSGVGNAKKTPLIQLNPDEKEELQSVNLGQSNREMEYQQWMAWLMKIGCAIYQIDPAELGFVFGAEGQTGALSQRGPEERIIASKERGLRPLLRAIEGWINRRVMRELAPELEFAFNVPEDEAARLELDVKAGRSYLTVNELRARNDLEPLDNPAADMGPLDASYLQMALQLKVQQEAGQEGGPGDAGAEPDDDEAGELPEDFDLDDFLAGLGSDDDLGDEDEGPQRGLPRQEPDPEPDRAAKAFRVTVEG